jgi:RNA polymerase sigma factor (sigma-70 family)
MKLAPFKKMSDEDLTAAIVAAQSGDVKARNTVIEYHLRIVIRLARTEAARFGLLHAVDDLVTAGTIGYEAEGGLLRAISSFDLKRNRKFSTYARKWILDEIRKAIADLVTVVGGNHRLERRTVATSMVDLSDEYTEDTDPESTLIDALDTARAASVLNRVELTPRELEVLTRRRQNQTLTAIADELGITRRRVNALEASILRKLKRAA